VRSRNKQLIEKYLPGGGEKGVGTDGY
jgi:hypothetical protein